MTKGHDQVEDIQAKAANVIIRINRNAIVLLNFFDICIEDKNKRNGQGPTFQTVERKPAVSGIP